ncbi:hypothetical protein [Vampirovibrio sp.]|uniref:hypothetical protein n=1 Tax=Vampirovibrio sp. TaxID=2717857 RepID=UPI0035937008
MEKHPENNQKTGRRLAWLREHNPDALLNVHREQQLRQSLEIMNQLINENAHRPESIQLLRKILRERAELQMVRHDDKNSLSG